MGEIKKQLYTYNCIFYVINQPIVFYSLYHFYFFFVNIGGLVCFMDKYVHVPFQASIAVVHSPARIRLQVSLLVDVPGSDCYTKRLCRTT